ncbi:DUF523 domain-containing protein [Ethanoligenens sp.]|uniref:DUF523 domain-containing protein n=1 Tax=Ethanoligenens sp. TaxID=2099655 RepID=UPI0039E957FC
MRKILVSGCLYGWLCRYDGKQIGCLDPRFLKWKEQGRLVPVCPEVFGGLTTPRPDSQRIGEKVIACTGEDVTAAYEAGAREALRLAQMHDVLFAIMKEDSPSCGSRSIYDGTFTGTKVQGEGRASQLLKEAGFRVLNETMLESAEALLAQEDPDA